MSRPCISVVVPSYNRAHILAQTLPSYLQGEVGELIVVDDCSTDNTQQVVAALMVKYPQIKYLCNEVNSKQGFTKNRGIEHATFEYIYFGDDDSLLQPGAFVRLLESSRTYKADIVGAKALYMERDEPTESFVERSAIMAKKPTDIVNVATMHANFVYSTLQPIEVPFCQACFMVPTKLARMIMFDTTYQGNAYREETDFLIRAALAGYKIVYDSAVVQINLPRANAGGGAHSGTSQAWYASSIENNNYFLDKNYAAMQSRWNLPHSIEQMRKIFRKEMARKRRRERCRAWLQTIGLHTILKSLIHSIAR